MLHTSHRLRLLFIIPLLALILAACGGAKEPIVEKPAGEINLMVQDLGPGWTLAQEQDGLEEAGLKPSAYRDANLRRYQDTRSLAQALGIVVTSKSAEGAAKEWRESDILNEMISSIQDQLPGITLEEIQPPAIADEQEMLHGQYARLNIYALLFRKANVFGMVMLIGKDDIATSEAIIEYAKAVVARTE